MDTRRIQQLHALEQELAREHKPILAALRGLEAMVESAPPSPGDLARRLEQVADQLDDHFRTEESGDLFGWFVDAFPQHKPDVDALRAQHAELVGMLRDLAEAAARTERVSAETEVAIRIRAAIATIRAHEVRETSLLQRVTADAEAGSI